MAGSKNYPCDDKYQLSQREGYYIREMGNMNLKDEGVTKEHHKEKHKQWNEKNKDKILEKRKEYYYKHIEKENENNKKYHKENILKIATKIVWTSFENFLESNGEKRRMEGITSKKFISVLNREYVK